MTKISILFIASLVAIIIFSYRRLKKQYTYKAAAPLPDKPILAAVDEITKGIQSCKTLDLLKHYDAKVLAFIYTYRNHPRKSFYSDELYETLFIRRAELIGNGHALSTKIK